MRVRALVAAALVAALTATGAGAADDLGALVLDQGQVGKGYALRLPADGKGTSASTLDLCGLRFASERKRVDRVQVYYVSPRSELGVSNEVVRYAPGGAAQALGEAAGVARRCPSAPVPAAGGGSLTYRVSTVSRTGFPPGSLVLSVHVVARTGGASQTLDGIAVYVRNGDILSGVYVYAGDRGARLALARRLAAVSVRKLSQSVGGQTA